MNHRFLRRGVVGLLLVALSLALMAPLSYADRGHRGHGKRYKGGRHRVTHVVRHYPRYPVRYVERHHWHSGAGPLIAGLVGGFVLGATLSHAAPPSGYSYYDPYCERAYPSLNVYTRHVHSCSHPAVVQVVHLRDHRCVGTYKYGGRNWHRYDDHGYRGSDRWDDRDDDERWNDRDDDDYGDDYDYEDEDGRR